MIRIPKMTVGRISWSEMKRRLPVILFVIIFLGSILIKALYTQYSMGLLMIHEPIKYKGMLLLSLAGNLILITALLLLPFNRFRYVFFLIADLVLSLVFFADALYFRYYQNLITIPVFYQVGLVESVASSILSLARKRDLIFIVDFPFLLALLIWIQVKGVEKIKFSKRVAMAALVFVLGLIPSVIASYNAERSTFNYDSNYVVRNLGDFYFHYYDVKKFIHDDFLTSKTLSASETEKIEAFFKNRKTLPNQYTGVGKGKNLIVIQVEALQQFIIGNQIEGQVITPNLNALQKDWIYMDNYYHQVEGGNTSDAEFMTNTSLYPVKAGAVYFRFPNRKYDSLPKKLNQQGYTSYVMHANIPSFWNRQVMYQSLGFDRYVHYFDYVRDEIKGYGTALSDASFFRQSLEKIDKTKPFYSFLITISSHHPFQYYDELDNLKVGPYEHTFFGNYLKAANYADACLGKFIEDLKKQGLYDNSVIAIYGDHYAIPVTERASLEKYTGRELKGIEWMKMQKVPCFIHYPGLTSGQTINKTAGEIDLLPTIANIMGLDMPNAMGKDILNGESGYVTIRSGYVMTDRYFYSTSDGGAFDRATGQKLSEESYVEEVKKIRKEPEISELIIQKDALYQMGRIK